VRPQKNKVTAILFGYAGCGKTSLYNNLCGTKEPVGFAHSNLTQSMISADCCHELEGQLRIFDTPGIV
jgi:predicted GTPase